MEIIFPSKKLQFILRSLRVLSTFYQCKYIGEAGNVI